MNRVLLLEPRKAPRVVVCNESGIKKYVPDWTILLPSSQFQMMLSEDPIMAHQDINKLAMQLFTLVESYSPPILPIRGPVLVTGRRFADITDSIVTLTWTLYWVLNKS